MAGLIAPDLMDRVTWSRPSRQAAPIVPNLRKARKQLWGSIPADVTRDAEELSDLTTGGYVVVSTRDICDLCRRMTRIERLQLMEHSGRLMCTHCRDRLRETDAETFLADIDACHNAVDRFVETYRPLAAALPDSLDILSEVYP